MTLKNNRAPLLCYFKLCTSFDSHRWFKLGLQSRTAHPMPVKISNFVPCDHDDLEKTMGHISYATPSLVDHFIAICRNSKWSYSPETTKLGFDLCDLDIWPLTLTFFMDITFVIGNNSWKRCDGRMDGQTDWTIHRAAWLQLNRANMRDLIAATDLVILP